MSTPPTRAARPGARRRSTASRTELIAVTALALAAAAALVFTSDAAPSGWLPADVVMLGAAALITTVAGSRARRWSLLFAAAVIVICSDGATLVAAAVALCVAMYLAWSNRRDRILGALVAALVVVSAGSLTWPTSPAGISAGVAAMSVLPVWASGYRLARRSTRRQIRIAAAAVLGIIGVGVLSGVVLVATQRDDLVSAIEDAQRAATEVVSGGTAQSAPTLRAASTRFESVSAAASSWWATPARIVPVLSQHVTLLDEVADAGADLSAAAADVAEQVDYDALQDPAGGIDVALLRSYVEPTAAAERAVENASKVIADVDSPWLIGPVSQQLDELEVEIRRAVAATRIAASAASEAPAMLGADGTRRYLLLLGNPAESRDIGGHIGNWATIEATDGRLSMTRSGSVYDLFGPMSDSRPELSPELDIPASLVEVDPTRFPQNWGGSPDLRAVGTLAADLYPQVAPGETVDGVLYADPVAFAALLKFTGPVQTPDGTTVDADNAVDYLTLDQFSRIDSDAQVEHLVSTTLDRFLDSRLPDPTLLADTLGPVVRSGHLQFIETSHSSELLTLTGLEVPVNAVDGTDTIAVLSRNDVPSKADRFLERRLSYEVDWDPDSGQVQSRLAATLTNTSPSEGLPTVVLGGDPTLPPGTNRTHLAVLTSLRPIGVMVDGETEPYSSREDLDGLQRLTVPLQIPPGSSVTVLFDLVGDVSQDFYRLRWFSQPLVNSDDAELLLRTTTGTLSNGERGTVVPLTSDRLQDLIIRAGP